MSGSLFVVAAVAAKERAARDDECKGKLRREQAGQRRRTEGGQHGRTHHRPPFHRAEMQGRRAGRALRSGKGRTWGEELAGELGAAFNAPKSTQTTVAVICC